MNEAEREAWRQWVTSALEHHPEAIAAALTATYTPVRIAAAQSTLALARALAVDPDERWIEPDGPGPACSFCGRTGASLRDDTVHGSRPEWSCTDEAACHRVRQDKLAGLDVTALPAGDDLATHQRHLEKLIGKRQGYYRQVGFKGRGYIGHEVVYQPQRHEELHGHHAPAWLTPLADDAASTLDGLDIARECIALAIAQAEEDDDLVALAGPPLTEPFIPARSGWWHPTLADPAHRGHLVGAADRDWMLGAKLRAGFAVGSVGELPDSAMLRSAAPVRNRRRPRPGRG